MPPKIKITADAILQTAYDIARASGINAATAQAISYELKCSTQPIYWAYGNMETLRSAVSKKAGQEYLRRQREYLSNTETSDAMARYKMSGLNYIRFAKDEPELFKILFMSNREGDVSLFQSELDGNKSELVNLIKQATGFNDEKANIVYVNNWVFAHGIATMCVTHTTLLTEDEISKMMYYASRGTISLLASV